MRKKKIDYKQAQRVARNALKPVRVAHESGTKGTFEPGIRTFKLGFKAGVAAGMVDNRKGAISAEIAKFKAESWGE